ncbi:TetR/AcrR family transcriptional regulator [Nitratireductor mangrovi]|uniref:TetR/AcrR family transcriptional regulator n=1 Tax=Nitratireductor mangrovi TaxID=2599600 RepID=A0A5B8L621_9HYPH|nr:TetR/AcrR family transcriptional regulator [Nitratireductor mangrovi]QDZ03299.1 TetR/AcrR family transcriptional regulator [Nitratireductor mangrovi]
MTRKVKRGTGRPRRQETDVAILDAALSIFLQAGFEGTSFEQVARRAGVSRATIYRRWASREEMIARALGRLKEESEEGAGARWEKMRLEELVEMMVEYGPKAWVDNDARRLLARVAGSVPDAPLLVQTFWEVYAAPRRAAFSAIVERARSERVLPANTDPELFQAMLGGAMMHKMLLEPGEKGEAELRAHLCAVLRQLGLGAVLDRLGR